MPFFQLPTGGASPVLVTNGPPTGSLGNVGDLAIDAANKLLYGPKDAVTGWPTGIDLSQGPTGSTGPTAPASTISIGTVTTGPTASVSVTGTAPSQTLSFVLPFATGPTGGYAFAATGPTAPASAGMTIAGAVWLDDTTGRYYVRYEDVFLEVGVQGERGPTGSTGPVSTVPGPTGTVGPTGSVGATGPSGGPTGATGSTGPQGDFSLPMTVATKTASYTAVLSDAGQFTLFSSSSATTFTVPPSSSVAFPTGTTLDVARMGTGAVSVTGATGVAIRTSVGNALRAQYSSACAILVGSDEWLLVGDLS